MLKRGKIRSTGEMERAAVPRTGVKAAAKPFAAPVLRASILIYILTATVAVVLALRMPNIITHILAAIAVLQSAVIILTLLHNQRILKSAAVAAAARAHKHNELIALALNENADGCRGWLWETDARGHLTYASQGLADGLGLTPGELTGRPFASLFDVEAGIAGWDRLLLALDARQAIECAAELPLGHATSWWQIVATPVTAPDGRYLGHRGVAHDITAERNARFKLVEERDIAIRDNAHKSQFLSMMSHELRTPLNAIVGFTELLLSPTACNFPEQQRHEHLETILEGSRNIQSLITDMLDAARIEKGQLQLVEREADAGEIVEVAVKMCRDAAEKADTTIIASLIDGIELRCDVTRIKQVLVSLVINAVKSSPPGAQVHVEVEKTDTGDLVIEIRDQGNGMGTEDLARVFEPFMQSGQAQARRRSGMGLGLPIAKRIAMLHGGDVTIESAAGAGTTARLLLPAARVSGAAQEHSGNTCAA